MCLGNGGEMEEDLGCCLRRSAVMTCDDGQPVMGLFMS